MKHAVRTAIASTLAALFLCSAAAAKTVSFQVPAANGFMFRGMNAKGEATGCYADSATGAVHGFLVQPDGALTTFDVPIPKNKRSSGPDETCATGISTDGVVSGWYSIGTSNGSFVRTVDGAITTFKVGKFTSGLAMNAKGWIAGAYSPHWKPIRPFLRDPAGATRGFLVPDTLGPVSATVLNRSRAIAGVATVGYPTTSDQAFFRPPHGQAALFGDPHSTVQVMGINDAATVVGSFTDTGDTQTTIAFLRTSDGTLTTFAGPNGASDTEARSINNSGTIVGAFGDSKGSHGFTRTADGTLTPFDVKGAYSTEIDLINDKGVIAGNYRNPAGYFGFIGKS